MTMRWILSLATLLHVFPATAEGISPGKVVPPYPDGSSVLGQCIAIDKPDDCQWLIGVVRNAQTSSDRVFAAKNLNLEDETPHWGIVDTRNAPALRDRQMWATEACTSQQTAEQGTIGIVEYADRGGWIEAQYTVWAVTFDVQKQELIELPPEKVECMLPGS